ncbi:MAG: hydroxymethylglutaryl-CoA lyase [bacterium]|nr:hydroxymethylglutaryl-CoA lyase [bacterium]
MAITIVEVGARDGLQSEAQILSTGEKIGLLNKLVAAGHRRIEAASFVSPRHVPQMADAEDVLKGMDRRDDLEVEALVPNARGMERALGCAIDRATLFVAASESFNQQNLRTDTAGATAAAREAARMARGERLPLRGAVVTAFGCPYEGKVPLEATERVVRDYIEMGCREIALADTTGMANPAMVRAVSLYLHQKFPDTTFALHLHNTRGAGLANLLAGLEAGITIFDTSIAGLGGCPFAPRATGNIATEDTVHMLHEMGHETRVDLGKLLGAAALAEKIFGRQLPGQLLHAGPVDWKGGGKK